MCCIIWRCTFLFEPLTEWSTKDCHSCPLQPVQQQPAPDQQQHPPDMQQAAPAQAQGHMVRPSFLQVEAFISLLHSRTLPQLASSIGCVYLTNIPQKSRIRVTKHLSTVADSSTNTTVGWTKSSRKPNFFEKRKKSKTQNLKKA